MSEKLPFFFGRVLGGRLARGKSRKNHKCRKTTKSLVVVWREIHLGLVIFRPSVGGRRARRSPGTCDFFGQVSENLKKYKGRGLLDETSLVGLCLFYLMSCISVFSRFTFLHRYNYVFVFKILPGYGRIRVRPHEVWSGEAGFYCVFELISSNPDSVVSSSSRFFV